jgi:hypothetical protein
VTTCGDHDGAYVCVGAERRNFGLEDHRWFYDLSVAIGRRLPSLTTEVNVVIGKAGLDAPEAP